MIVNNGPSLKYETDRSTIQYGGRRSKSPTSITLILTVKIVRSSRSRLTTVHAADHIVRPRSIIKSFVIKKKKN